jgi:hypothetical protein
VAPATPGDDGGVTPRPRLVAAGVAVTLLGGVGLLTLRRLDRTRPVTVDQAVDRFRSPSPGARSAGPGATSAPAGTPSPGSASRPSGTAGAPDGGPAPDGSPGMTGTTRTTDPEADPRTPEGVYVYATTGYETADAGVSTARHDYPASTTVTVRYVPCGTSVRWDPTQDRWDDVTVCAGAGSSRVTAYKSYHRFFGQAQEHDYTCGGTSYFRPPVTRAGYRWTFDCTTGDAKAHTDAVFVGTETVNGARALHVRYATTLTGSSRGTNPQEFWLAVDGPYVLRQTSRVDADVDTPFGTIRYHEEYALRLTSRTPRR